MTDGPGSRDRLSHVSWSSVRGWLKSKDPGFLAVKRSVRAAVVVPSVFGFTHAVFANPQIDLFGAFGSFALLLLVDFPGRPRTRLLSYLGLFVLGVGFIALGTAVSTHKIAAVATMAVVGFGVLFVGIVSPQAATASTAALLVFVLPVAVAQPTSAIGDRLLGWVIAAAVSITACMLVWPTPWHDNLRRRLSATVSAVGRLVASSAEGRNDPDSQEAVKTELTLLRKQFAGTPYPPTGAVAGAVALAKLVGRVEWVASNAAQLSHDALTLELSSVAPVIGSVAETLRHSADLICDGKGRPVDDSEHATAVKESIRHLDETMTAELDHEVSSLLDTEPALRSSAFEADPDRTDVQGTATMLDPAFRVRALGIATEMMGDSALESSGSQAVGDRRLGAGDPRERTLWLRLVAHLSFHSVWFRNALRGGAGLALAVAVVEVTDVEHGFWVVLGTLSVLRSNALGTGATALRAIGGTAVGFVVGSAIMIGVANQTALLWILLPLAVLVAGVVPSMISFAAGQAGFTLVVIILFNIIDPIGWRVGLTRIEDVAIGCGVSIVVGVLFWPRGATAALGRALSEAFVASSGYLADAVSRLTATHTVDTLPAQRASHNAYMRLDDAFRQFVAERGAKKVSIETVANLFTGSNRIRLAAFTLATAASHPLDPGKPELESVAIAGAVLRDSYAASHRWYEEFAETLSGRRDQLEPPPAHDDVLSDVLVQAFEDARDQHRGDRLRTTLQMLWADELLENQRQVQADLAASAQLFVRR